MRCLVTAGAGASGRATTARVAASTTARGRFVDTLGRRRRGGTVGPIARLTATSPTAANECIAELDPSERTEAEQ